MDVVMIIALVTLVVVTTYQSLCRWRCSRSGDGSGCGNVGGDGVVVVLTMVSVAVVMMMVITTMIKW